MKLIHVVLLLSCLGFGQNVSLGGYISSPKPEPSKSFVGQYVLVTRHWEQGSCCIVLTASGSLGTGENSTGSWEYTFKPFASRADALAALQKDCGSGYPCIHSANDAKAESWTGTSQFIAIYKLSPELDQGDVKLTEGDHVQQRVIEDKTHWFQWDIKEKKEAKK